MSLALQSFELVAAVPQVIGHRVTRMALAGLSPSARDRREFHRMGVEKVAATVEAWNGMAWQAFTAYQRWAWSFTQSLWFPWAAPAPTMRSASRYWSDAALGILGKGMVPIRRRAVANAKRLGRIGRR